MTVLFNRRRSKTAPKQYQYKNDIGSALPYPGVFYWVGTDGKRIDDIVPVGKYTPTKAIKVTSVHIAEVKLKISPLRLEWYWEGKLQARVSGSYIISAIPMALNSGYLPDLAKDDPLRVQDLKLRALAKVNEDSLGLGETASETVKSLKMLKNPLEGMRKIFQRVLHRRRGGRRTAEDAGSAWLEYRYGWMPLYLFVCDLIKEGLPHFSDGEILSFAAKDVVRTNTSVALGRRVFYGTYSGRAVLNQAEKLVKDEFQVRYYLRVTNARDFNALKRGGSLFNVPSFLYEKATLSFALDWWFSLGDYIGALAFTPGVIYHPQISISAKRVETIHNEIIATSWTTNWTGNEKSLIVRPFCSSEKLIYRRLTEDVSLPTPPNLDKSFNSVKHALDALALIIQRIPRRK